MKTAKVYMWRCDNVSDELYIKMYESVSPERREKADRLAKKEDKILSLAAEFLLNIALKNSGVNEFEIQADENKKPYLLGREDVFFNLSHTENMVMCVVADSDIGCDVEKIKGQKTPVAKRYFCESECRYIENMGTDDEKADAFYKLWTLKESFLKAKGTGLKKPMSSFEMKENCGRFFIENEDLRFFEFRFDDYRFAVCGRADKVEVEMVEFSEE